MKKRLLSLFDLTGNWSLPYEQAGWEVTRIDIQRGFDVFAWNYKVLPRDYFNGILIAQPCTDFAISGAKHFERKDSDGSTLESLSLVYKSLAIVQYFKQGLEFWVFENPMSRIHKLAPELGEISFRFHPYEFAGYTDNDEERYCKTTWLWGEFNNPEPKPLTPLKKENPGWKNLGGKSLKTKNERSKTPLGFAYGFYEYNNLMNSQLIINEINLLRASANETLKIADKLTKRFTSDHKKKTSGLTYEQKARFLAKKNKNKRS